MPHKVCQHCKEEKEASDFVKDKSSKSGLGPRCLSCMRIYQKAWRKNNPGKVKATQEKFLKRNPEYKKSVHRKYRYGLNNESYEKLFKSQNGLCGICFCEMKNPHIDHCHTTLKIRGLLCINCNTMIGQAKNSTVVLLSAINYLTKGKT